MNAIDLIVNESFVYVYFLPDNVCSQFYNVIFQWKHWASLCDILITSL